MASYRKRNNTWEYRITYVDRQTGKQRETSKGGFRTKAEAKIAATEAESDFHQYGFMENGSETVNHYFNEWLETFKRPHVKPITYSVQERVVRLNILTRWGNYRLKDINRLEYQKWINVLRENYSAGTVRRIHSIVSCAIDDAVHEFQLLRQNPLKKISIPKEIEKDERIAYFSREQLDVFLNQVKPVKNSKYQHSMQYLALFTLMARSGIRIGEALALQWDDLDSTNHLLTISKTLVYPLNSEPYISTPKTKSSRRTIKLDTVTMQLLEEHRTNQQEVIQMYPYYKATKDNIIFHQHDGRWLRTNVVRDYFKTVCKRAGLSVLSPHALRHSHAVHLLEAGANIKYVSERLGHASVKITADTYLHNTAKIENDALELYSRYLK